MRVRHSIIIEESIMKQIDEIAGDKPKRAATIERALKEFIAREEKKGKRAVEAPVTNTKKAKAIASAEARR